MISRTLDKMCNITTGKLDANQAVPAGAFPFYTCAQHPDTIDSFAFDDDVVLVAGNNANGNFHVNRYNGKFNAYQRTYVLTAKQGACIDYVYYVLKLELRRLKERAQGSQTKFLTMPILTGINFNDIDFDAQKEISQVLASIDKKIELNNKINAELEAMAKLIYDYWFVQFDFPDASGKPYKSTGGKMVYNEALKLEIPEGWDSEYIENLLAKEPRNKKLPKTHYKDQGDYAIIDQSTDFICGYTDDKDTVIEAKVPRIVFGDHTRILKLLSFDFARGADGTQVLLSNNNNVPQHFFYHSLLKIDLSSYGYARHFKFLKQTRTIVPDSNTANQFEEAATSFYSQVSQNIFETKKLEELRDWLLPMLMNGQVRVKS